MVNPLKPNDLYERRTAPLASKVSFYIFIQQVQVLNILNMVYTVLFFFLFKMQFHNSNISFLYYSHFIYRVC